jgi:hypothetical protein
MGRQRAPTRPPCAGKMPRRQSKSWEVFTSPPRRAAACGLGGSHAAAPLARRGRAGEATTDDDQGAALRPRLAPTGTSTSASSSSGAGCLNRSWTPPHGTAPRTRGGPDLTAWLGLDGEPVEALDLVQRLLRAAGWTMTVTATGLLTLRRLVTASASPDHALTGALIPDVQGQRPRFEDAADAVVATWGLSPVGPRQRTYTDPAASERHLAQGAQIELDLSPPPRPRRGRERGDPRARGVALPHAAG